MPAWSGLWNRHYGENHSLLQKFTSQERAIKTILGRGIGGRKLRATLLALTGAVPNTVSKAVTQRRITHKNNGEHGFGGKRTTEVATVQSGNASTADLTRIDTNLAKSNKPSYPKDKAITNNALFGRGAQ